MKAMGPFPEERFRSLGELRYRLEGFVEGRPEADDRPPIPPRRPLKGLVPTPADLAFAPIVLNDQPTRVIRKPVTAEKPKVQAATSLLQEPEVPSVGRRARRYLPLFERAGWVACGAAVALVIAFAGLRPKRASSPSSVPSALASGSASTSTPTVVERSIEPPSLATEPEPTVFDAELAGRNAAKAARDCFAPERGSRTISFGVGLLYAKDEALSRRTYLPADETLSAEERGCITHALVGVSSGAAPSKNTIVDLRFRLRPDGTDEVRAVVQK
jgi:hypothetical protein